MNVKLFATAAVAVCALSPSAFADAGSSDCSRLSRQVTVALDANGDSPNIRVAQIEASNGRTLCSANEFDKGVAHYQKALDLLGQAH